jgi:parallel beta-helix repeat protein
MSAKAMPSRVLLALGLVGAAGLGPATAMPAAAAPAGAASAAGASATSPSEGARRAATVEAERQADLVAGEDQRLMEALVAGLPTTEHPKAHRAYRVSSSGLTLVLTKRRAPYTFDDLRKLAAETLVPQSKHTFLLRENIVVAEGATLSITPNQPLKIKMRSGPDGFVSLIGQGGRLRLNGSAAAPISFESWDESRGRQDTEVTDGRAYVRASGQLVARHTSFSRLGFWSGRTGGVSVVGSGSPLGQGLDAGAATGDPAVAEPAGKAGSGKTQLLPAGKLPSAAQDPDLSYGTQISDATMTGNAFGLFVTGNSGARIENTVIRKSLVDGLVLHRDVHSASVTNVRVERSGSDGVVVSRKVEGTVLTRLVVRQNGRDGIVLAGKPLADGPSASGSSTRAFGNNVLTASQSSDNTRIGIHVIGGTAVRVQGNTVNGGRSGIVVSDGAADIDVDSNRVAGATANGIQVRESRKVTVTGNVVRNAQTGIHVRNSSGTFRQNSTSGVTLHGITFVGQVAGSVVGENLLSGSGTSAIDLVRVTDQQVPKLDANDLSGWSRTVTGDSLLSVLLHPLTVIWILIALLLLAMSRPDRRGNALPYRVDPLAPAARPVVPPAVQRYPAPDEPTREFQVPVFTPPERRVPVPAAMVAPATAATATASVLAPVTGRLGPLVPGPAHAAQPEPEPQPAGRPGLAVIDLAIREARLNPAAPRRRRAGGR